MVDFNKLRAQKNISKAIDPIEIFRRLAKPVGINDLYTSQAEVLSTWFSRRDERDTILKLHTGGGKTLVGLLAAQSTLNETGEPVLYLTPTVQLVKQTIEKANEIGIPAVAYENKKPLHDDFVNGNAIMVATYKALFNGRSQFGLRGGGQPQNVSAVILDDAHAAFDVVRDSFSLEISEKEQRPLYEEVAGIFRKAFIETIRVGTFDDILDGREFSVLEVPYWAWQERIGEVRELLKKENGSFTMVWPLLRDHLHLCHAFISRKSFTITPILPLVNLFPTFHDAARRIYMSATIADDSEIIRTFDAKPSAQDTLTSRSLAGISERMILVPDLMPFEFNSKEAISKLLEWTAKKDLGSVILTSSDNSATEWGDIATIAKGSSEAEKYITNLQNRKIIGPVVFANRYDGMDLPGDSCRLLVMSGLPSGTSNYEMFRAGALFGGKTITRMMAQRIEQGMGRGSRGSGDYCVIILAGSDIAGWISKNANFTFLTSATKAQLEMGMQISKEVKSLKDLADIIAKSYNRNKEWIEYHAETLAELVTDEEPDELRFKQAKTERRAINLWQDGLNEKAITEINNFLDKAKALDKQMRGWMEQLAARIADNWGHREFAEDMQRRAFSHNRNLIRPKVLPPYTPMQVPGNQAKSIISQIRKFSYKKGFLNTFEEIVSLLNKNSSANQFEQALCDLAQMIGLKAERHDVNGEGPDVLWMLPNKIGFVIEAKSRKKEKNALTKDEHGQLLVAAEWFAKNYPEYTCVRISVHPKNKATKAAVAGASHALTYEKLEALISDARILLATICDSPRSNDELVAECNRLLSKSTIHYENIADTYLCTFEEIE